LTLLPETYFGLGAAILTCMGALAWARRRKRPRPIVLADRIEPIGAVAADDPLAMDPPDREDGTAMSGTFQQPREPEYPPAALADWTPSRPDADYLAAVAVACEYKGFKIGLAEKQPGLWIGIVTADGKKKKRLGQEPWTTREFYQRPAALAEAKALVDRGAR
jgi:hypothetical protein